MLDDASTQWVSSAGLAALSIVIGLMTAGAIRLLDAAARRWRLRDELAGTIVDDGGGAVAEVVVEQELEHKDGLTRWREERRTPTVRPFRVRLDGGAIISVDDVAGWRLWWPMPPAGATEGRVRQRIARVMPGERVVVAGVRAQASAGGAPYRADAVSAARTGQLTIVEPALRESLRGFGKQLLQKAGRSGATGVVVAACLALLALTSTEGRGVLRDVEFHGNAIAHLVVDGDGRSYRFEVVADAVRGAAPGEVVSLRRGPWPFGTRLGGGRVHMGVALAAFFMGLGLLVAAAYTTSRLKRRQWFELDRFDEPA
jgi:hypothetical protein